MVNKKNSIKELKEEIDNDLKFSFSTIGEDMVRQPILHHKYVKRLMAESWKAAKLQEEYDSVFKKQLHYYLTGYEYDVDSKTAARLANADEEVRSVLRMLRAQESLVSYLEKVVGMFNQRNYTISNAVKFIMFREGS